MKILELFAGSRSVGKAAQELGMEVFSSDINAFEGIDYVVDIMEFDYTKVPFVPDIIWASPPCTGFSVAAIGRNWTKGSLEPKTETARLGLVLLKKTIEMIQHYLKLNPNLIWYIENPRGMMRKMPCMQNLIRHTVTYCQYGDKLVYNLIFNMDNKKCPKCGKIKDIGEFYKNKCRRDGFTSYCKDCISIDSSDYHSRNKEKCKERLQEWREKNREYVRERDIKYRTDNPEIEFNKQKRYRENHINELYLKGKKYREEHSDYFYNKARERKLSQKEVSDGSITLEFEKYLFDSQNGKCGYCGCSLEESGKHLDHIYPLSKGGLHTSENVHWTCPTCNLSKGDKTEGEWIKKSCCKPTDIWTNNLNWKPRTACKNGDTCHIAAPRGSSTGTQGLKGAYERSKIPHNLCLEILTN